VEQEMDINRVAAPINIDARRCHGCDARCGAGSGPGDPATLADVLILGADGRTTADQCADLFAHYPGLSLVMIATAADTIDVGLRDGSVRSVRGDGPIQALAGYLYAWWCRRQIGRPASQISRPRRPLSLQDLQALSETSPTPIEVIAPGGDPHR
jgi:hypothetical protein